MLELAYIDAGTGSLIIQAAIASVAAVIIFFRTQFGRLIPGRRKPDAAESAAPRDDASQGS